MALVNIRRRPTSVPFVEMELVSTPDRTTLLVFTRGADADCRRRPVLPHRLRGLERQLRTRCVESVIEAGRHCGFEIVVASDRSARANGGAESLRQKGTSFGERFTRALEECWSQPSRGSVVVVGGDIPGLGDRHLRRAAELLDTDADAVVIGPSPDGGLYLLASNRPLTGALGRVRWCSGDARRDLVESLRRRGLRIHFLEPLVDLDRPADLTAVLSSRWADLDGRHLARWIRAALRRLLRPVPMPVAPYLAPQLASAASERGPPA